MKEGVHRWVSTIGEEVLVLPVTEPYEYNPGDPTTTLVKCLVLHSEHQGSESGDVRAFAASSLKPFASGENEVE